MGEDKHIELSRLRNLAKAWRDGSICEEQLKELQNALPEALDFAADRFWPVCQAWAELNACTEAWRERVAYCDANNIDHKNDIHTFVCEWFFHLAVISYGRNIYDLLGPPPEDSCTSAEMAQAEKNLLFWIDRLRTKEVG
jgi:hypothetical protein